jgi:hypothetical protein
MIRPIFFSYVCRASEQSPCAFLFVQLRGLEAHVISQTVQEGKVPPSRPVRLMPPASEQSPCAFLFMM